MWGKSQLALVYFQTGAAPAQTPAKSLKSFARVAKINWRNSAKRWHKKSSHEGCYIGFARVCFPEFAQANLQLPAQTVNPIEWAASKRSVGHSRHALFFETLSAPFCTIPLALHTALKRGACRISQIAFEGAAVGTEVLLLEDGGSKCRLAV